MSDETIESSESTESPKRGFWLIGFIVLMLISNSLTAFSYLTQTEVIMRQIPSATYPIMYFLAFMSVINIGLAIAIVKWKKWGLYGAYISAGIAFIINLNIGIGIVPSVLGLLGVFILFLLTKYKWEHFT